MSPTPTPVCIGCVRSEGRLFGGAMDGKSLMRRGTSQPGRNGKRRAESGRIRRGVCDSQASEQPTHALDFRQDLQLGHLSRAVRDNDERARRLIERVAEEQPDFVIDGGDHINGAVCDDRSERTHVKRMWRDYHRIMEPLREVCPVISTIGNHDQTGSAASSEEYCLQTGRAGKPTYYAATVRGVHVVTLDTVVGWHRGGFAAGTAQARWLRRHLPRLRKAPCTVVVGHYPILTASWLYDIDAAVGQGALFSMLVDAGVDLYLCGHLHAYERARNRRLTQAMAGPPEIAYAHLRVKPPGKDSKVFDERQGYICFTLGDASIRGEAVSLEGEVMDQWTQKLNPKHGQP